MFHSCEAVCFFRGDKVNAHTRLTAYSHHQMRTHTCACPLTHAEDFTEVLKSYKAWTYTFLLNTHTYISVLIIQVRRASAIPEDRRIQPGQAGLLPTLQVSRAEARSSLSGYSLDTKKKGKEKERQLRTDSSSIPDHQSNEAREQRCLTH